MRNKLLIILMVVAFVTTNSFAQQAQQEQLPEQALITKEAQETDKAEEVVLAESSEEELAKGANEETNTEENDQGTDKSDNDLPNDSQQNDSVEAEEGENVDSDLEESSEDDEDDGQPESDEPEYSLADSLAMAAGLPMLDYKTPQKYIINEINVHGVNFLDVSNLIAVSGLKKGDEVVIPGDYISKAIKNFWNRRYFSDVNIVGEIVGDSVNLDVYFQQRPLVYTWEFEGIRKGQASDLKEKLDLKRGHELSDFTINRHVNQIKDYYYEKGFRNIEVEPQVVNDTIYNNAVTVTYIVNRNSRVKIGEIDFVGNEAFKDKQLRRTFKKTHRKSWNFFKSSRLKDKEYEEDKENLLDFYNSKGYRNAMIVYDSIYDINDKRIGLEIKVDEGNKYYFRDITWVGNSRYDTEFLQRMLGLEKGDLYDKKTMHKRLGIAREADPDDPSAITSLYQNDGYLFFTIDPAETIIGEDSIDLELKIYEGKQATINEVRISGNLRVNDEVIRRELQTRPGELYDRSMLMNTMRLLSQMQHFNPEAVMPEPIPISAELVDINWNLEEQASDRAEISGGWGAGMFVGSIGLELNNLSLKDFFKKGSWRPYPQGQSQQLRIRAQSNGSYYKSFSVSFTEPWVGGRKPNSLTVSTHYSDETDAYYMWQRGNKHFRTMGISVGIGRRLNWPDPYFTLYNEISYQSYQLKDWDYFIFQNGSSNIFAFTTVFGRNSVDQPIYPRRGSDFSLSLTLTPPYSLMDGRDYSDETMPENQRYKWIEYHKWKFKGEWYFPISRNENLVLMAKAEMGYIGNYDKNKPSPFEGFEVGGDGMSGYNIYGVDVIGMRGYENSALSYIGNSRYANAYNKYTLELRYPFILKPSSTIYGLIFAEGGNAFESWNKFNPFQIKRSLGVGVRLFLPIVGMLGVDWGYGFDKAPGQSKRSGGQIHYMIGMQF